jgi:hypothetical protein
MGSFSKKHTVSNGALLVVAQKHKFCYNFIPGYQMAFQTDNQGRRFLAKDTFQKKNASVSDVWQAQFTLRYTFGN